MGQHATAVVDALT